MNIYKKLIINSEFWMPLVLRVAGIYNLLWGALAIFAPITFFHWVGFDPIPHYPVFWQCIGMIVGVYGLGYWIAAQDPLRHWPIIFVGLTGKVLGPIGFLNALYAGQLPMKLGWTIITNDLIWWIPFTIILWKAARAGDDSCRTLSPAGSHRYTGNS